jgi:Bacterial Ig domain
MKRLFVGVTLALVTAAAPAQAETQIWSRGYVWAGTGPVGSKQPAATVSSHVLFLNNCKTASCTLTPGSNDSRTNKSTVAEKTGTLAAFPYSDAVWNQVVDCVKATYAPFNLQIVTTEPSPGTSYFEEMVGGQCSDIMNPDPDYCSSGSLGISPFTGGVINNAISFTFAAKSYYATDSVNRLCWTIAQESAHAFGLDHEYLKTDPMTYLDGGEPKRFQNVDAPCGTNAVATCYSGASTQNSVAMLRQIVGSAAATPPAVAITSPGSGAVVTPGFLLTDTVADADGVTRTELYVDGIQTVSLPGAVTAFHGPDPLGQGSHRVEVRAYDLAGTAGSAFIDVVMGKPCEGPSDCNDDTKTCVDGRCVTAPGQPGGLGETCTGAADCASTVCGSDGTNKRCVEACDPGMQACPSGFGCTATSSTDTSQGVCWPGAAGDGNTAGGCRADGGGAAPIGIGLAFAALALRRRRRR